MFDWFLRYPEVASEHGAQLDHVTNLVHLLMLVLFLFWGGLFVYLLVRFRAGRQPKANYHGLDSRFPTYGEVGVVLAEATLLIGFSIPLFAERIGAIPSERDAVVVRVVAEQFAWNVHYPGPDGVFGRTDPSLVDAASNAVGLDEEDPAAADDIVTLNQLHLPVDRPALLHLTSKDVIHAFAIAEMRVKQDAIPGMQFPVWFVPTVTTEAMRARTGDEEFGYQIGCAQLCGLGHYRMQGFVTIHDQTGFDAWLDEQQRVKAEETAVDDFWG